MSEATQWTTVKKHLRCLDPIRVDNSATPGHPDVDFGGVLDGRRLEGRIELKWERSWPVRPNTPLRIPHYTPQQRIWHRRRWKRGGLVVVLLQVGRSWLLFDGLTAARHLGYSNRSELERMAIRVWSNGLPSGELVSCLQEISVRGNACFSTGSDQESDSEPRRSSTESGSTAIDSGRTTKKP